jgi:hypothetical protein
VGDFQNDTLEIIQVGGTVQHNRFSAGDAGFNSDSDFDSTLAGDQIVPPFVGTVSVDTGSGATTVRIGSEQFPASDLQVDIALINPTFAGDSLHIDDTALSNIAYQLFISEGLISSFFGVSVSLGGATFGGGITIDTPDAIDDLVRILSATAGQVIRVNTHDGDDTVRLEGNLNDLDPILGQFQLDLGGEINGDILWASDTSDDDPNSYIINADSIIRSGLPAIVYSEIEFLQLFTTSLENVVTTRAVPGLTQSHFGGDPAAEPGDRLVYDAEGVCPTIEGDVISSPLGGDVQHVEFESLQIVDCGSSVDEIPTLDRLGFLALSVFLSFAGMRAARRRS